MRTIIIGIVFLALTIASVCNSHTVRHSLKAMGSVNVALTGGR